MKLEVVENEGEKVKIKIDDLTFVNLLNEVAWTKKADMLAYAKEHPYLSDPVLLIHAKNPKKVLMDAAAAIEKDAADLKKKMKTVLK